MNNLTLKIDRLAEIKRQQDMLKREKDKLEAEISKICEHDLENTKYKSADYRGSAATLKAVNAESLKITYDAFLPIIFGKAYKNAVTEKTTYTLSKPATRMLIALWKGDYFRGSVEEVVNSIVEIPEADRKQILKKCKGVNFEKDVQNILKFTYLTTEDAQMYAYLIAEAAVWENFINLLSLNGINNEQSIQDILGKIRSAFVVEETTKISLVVDDDDA